MKKAAFLFVLLISVQTTASHYDVIYRFESQSQTNDDYFVIKFDFDYVAPDDLIFGDVQQVFNYEEFEQTFNNWDFDFAPVYFFEAVVVETNMSIGIGESIIGRTRITATNQPMSSIFGLGPSTALRTNYLDVEPQYFPTAWEPGLVLFDVETFDNYLLTEITPVPLPAALPLFGFCVSLLTRSKPRRVA